MVIKEKTEKTNGPHLRLNMPFASESDFICFDKATQTSSEDTLEDPFQVKANPYTALIFVPGKEKYYVWKTRSRLQEKCPTVLSGLEFKNFLLEEKHKTGITDLEHHESISLNPITEECNEKLFKTDPTATITGQILLAVASLRNSDRNNIQAAATMLNSLLKKEKNKLRGKVPEIIDIIYFHLNAIQDRSAREAAIGAATKALGIIFKDKRCKVPMNSFYVSVIIFLVIQLHYLVSSLDADYGQEDILKASQYISCTMETLKALIKREKSSQTCFTSLTENWDLLSSPENYIEGVLLLARALVKNHHGLDYAVFTKVIPFLHHGDDQQKLTAMAFFTARKELTSLILSILPNFNDSDEKVTLTAFEVVTKEVAHHKYANHVLLKIVKQLHPFLIDRRDNICCAANQLFQDIFKTLDTKDKPSMQDQVLNSIVTLMLNLEDPHQDVAKSRTNSLELCKTFLGWTANDENFWNVLCKHLVKEYPGKLRGFLDQAQEYTQSPQQSSRIAAATFIGLLVTQPLLFVLALRSFPSERCSVPVVSEPEKVCRTDSLEVYEMGYGGDLAGKT
ncbi:hypothetical protein Chor_000759 [Crotalus horridus]